MVLIGTTADSDSGPSASSRRAGAPLATGRGRAQVHLPHCGDDLYGAATESTRPPRLPIKATDLGKVIAEAGTPRTCWAHGRETGTCSRGPAPASTSAPSPAGSPGRLIVEIAEDGTPVLTDTWAIIKAARLTLHGK